eukprot:6194179-Pleurochrysis_carterae.AAC.2
MAISNCASSCERRMSVRAREKRATGHGSTTPHGIRCEACRKRQHLGWRKELSNRTRAARSARACETFGEGELIVIVPFGRDDERAIAAERSCDKCDYQSEQAAETGAHRAHDIEVAAAVSEERSNVDYEGHVRALEERARPERVVVWQDDGGGRQGR